MPLYCSRDAPMRRRIAISTCHRRHGFTQLRSDCCVFGCFGGGSSDVWAEGIRSDAQCLILSHVDDIIFIGDEIRKQQFVRAIQEFDHGPIDVLGVGCDIVYCGMTIRINREDMCPSLKKLSIQK